MLSDSNVSIRDSLKDSDKRSTIASLRGRLTTHRVARKQSHIGKQNVTVVVQRDQVVEEEAEEKSGPPRQSGGITNEERLLGVGELLTEGMTAAVDNVRLGPAREDCLTIFVVKVESPTLSAFDKKR